MKKLLLNSLALLFTLTLVAQKGKVLDGKWKSLSGIEHFAVQFDYANVEIPDFDTEEDYLTLKIKEKEDDKPGQGAIWREKYFADRENHFEPKFIESFNKRGDKKVSKSTNNTEYTLKVITTRSYNGWNVGVMRKAARIDAIIEIYKNDEQLFKVKYLNVKGGDAMGYDFSAHTRVAEAYAKLAKSFMRDFKKKA